MLIFLLFVLNQVLYASDFRQEKILMAERGRLASAMIINEKTKAIDLSELNNKFIASLKQTGTRLFIYDASGKSLYPGGKSAASLSPPSRFPAIYQKKKTVFYTDKLTSDHQTVGYIRLTAPHDPLKGLVLLDFFLFIAGLFLLYYHDRLIKRYVGPVTEAALMTEEMLEGDYSRKASNNVEPPSVLRLNLAMNRLSQNVNMINKSYAMQLDSMATLTENIGNGLLVIDGNGRISHVNKTYKETFKTGAEHWINARYQYVIPYQEVIQMIDEVFRTGEQISDQLKITVHIERKHFDVSCAPILDKNRRLRGIVVVFHDITELKKLEKMRKDFVANVSHELKTPVTSVIGFTETLLDGAKDDKELEEKFLNIILHESRRLQSLITDLLELSKIEKEHFSIQWQNVSLNSLLDEVLLIFSEKAAEKDIVITKKAGSEGLASGDPYRIRQIMINLINNAIAYTPKHGKISLEVRESATGAQFVISDTGIGIAKKQIPRIFERFYRIDKARSRDLGGTGLGLAIVKHLVEAHEGRIDVDSEVGKGTTFIITFKKPSSAIG